ncbi:MAG TPA: polymer-forming cytoskeletal protein [Acidimicrobiia bacterium]|nr:polymer-forming cytoskeletal protein [Acidimicrobiia bacterium]
MRLTTRRDERGAAMLTAMTVMLVMAALAAVVLANGSRAERGAGRGRNWTQALHVAEAGVEEAVAHLQATNGALPSREADCAATVPAAVQLCSSTNEGDYEVAVTYLGRNRYEIEATGRVGSAQGLASERKLRVVIAPPPSFLYALFSLTDVDTKNNNYVEGDIWANGSVSVEQGDTVDGSVNAATGWIFMNNNSTVTGDLHSGGQNGSGVAIDVSTGAVVEGKVKASSSTPACADDPSRVGYQVNVIGSITGTVTTWGSKTGGGATGTLFEGVCTEALATKTMPVFTYDPRNYDPNPYEFASVADFQNWLDTAGFEDSLSGTFFVSGSGAIDLTGVTITGDTTIIAYDAAINANGVESANSNDKLFILVSFYAPPAGSACTDGASGNPLDCAVGMKNNFQTADNVATLIYAPNGPVAFKNNAEFTGAVYSNDIVLKNNQSVVYDARVEQIVGFGPVTLSRDSWLEVTGE